MEQNNNEIDNICPKITGFSESTSESEELEMFDDEDLMEAESVNVTSDKKFDPKSIEVGEYINKDIVPVKRIKCIIPSKLLDSIREIEIGVNKKFGSSNEFSIFIHGDYDPNGYLVVSEDFYIPKQVVSGASVQYNEEPEPHYNGCLHKHPDGCTSFSGTDEKYINSNFDFSLLYVQQKISKGIINIHYDGIHRIQCDLNIQMDNEKCVCGINIDNITKNVPKTYQLNRPYNPLDVPTLPGMYFPGFNEKTGKETKEIIMPHVYPNALNLDDESEPETDSMEFFSDPELYPNLLGD